MLSLTDAPSVRNSEFITLALLPPGQLRAENAHIRLQKKFPNFPLIRVIIMQRKKQQKQLSHQIFKKPTTYQQLISKSLRQHRTLCG